MPTALWDGLVDDVVTLTNRPGLVNETILGLKQGTMRAHLLDKFPRDLVITDYVDPSGESVNELAIPTTSTFTRFRDVSAVQLLDVDSEPLSAPVVELCEIDGIYEPSYPGVKKPWVAWLAGTSLNVYSVSGMYGARTNWWQSPNLDPDTYNSWIAESFPDVIVWYAARLVWNRSGNDAKMKEANIMLGDIPPINFSSGLYHDLRVNFLSTAGR